LQQTHINISTVQIKTSIYFIANHITQNIRTLLRFHHLLNRYLQIDLTQRSKNQITIIFQSQPNTLNLKLTPVPISKITLRTMRNVTRWHHLGKHRSQQKINSLEMCPNRTHSLHLFVSGHYLYVHLCSRRIRPLLRRILRTIIVITSSYKYNFVN